YTWLVVNYPFAEANSQCNWFTFTPSPTYLLTSITLANGRSYGFTYLANSDGTTTGEITQITLPAGGYIRYDYQSVPLSIMDHCFFVQGNGQDRVVAHRFVSPDGTASSEQKWTYAYSIELGSSQTTIVTDPLNNSQVYVRPWGSPLPSEVDY